MNGSVSLSRSEGSSYGSFYNQKIKALKEQLICIPEPQRRVSLTVAETLVTIRGTMTTIIKFYSV